MSESTTFYRMNILMNCAEIDAFAAQKNASSKTEYFDKLFAFEMNIPAMAEALTAPENGSKAPVFLDQIDRIQEHLIGIGSSSLLWEAQQAADFAREEKLGECAKAVSRLVPKLKTLCAKIEEARVDAIVLSAPTREVTEPEVLEEQERRQVAAKPEPFEKLSLLIENCELDDALSMLHSLMKYSYGSQIDAMLNRVSNNIVQQESIKAYQEMKNVLQIVQALQSQVKRKKILAIDDVPDVLNTVKAVLREHYAVYGVTNHKAALKFLTSNSADLILLDIEMPDMNGFTLLSLIRKMKSYEKTPVLFLTGNVSVENIKKSHVAGSNDFIRKPIDAQVLLSRIEKHLEGE